MCSPRCIAPSGSPRSSVLGGAIVRTTRLAALGALVRSAGTVAMAPLNEFLALSSQALHQPSSSTFLVVMGNEAGDPDCCACAISMARLLAEEGAPGRVVVPVLSVSRADFALQLDRLHLLRRAGLRGSGDGISWRPSDIAFMDEVDLEGLRSQNRLQLCLVDHNRLSSRFAGLAECVTHIVDHHEDEGAHMDLEETNRIVEFGIGSCSSLVTEQMRLRTAALLSDGALCTLLLGAILLDTANLTPEAKAQKAREVELADTLLESAAPFLGLEPTKAGRDVFFNELLHVKTDVDSLLSFPTLDLLRQDYKCEELPASLVCGISSIIIPARCLLQAKPDIWQAIVRFSRQQKLALCILMCLNVATQQREIFIHAEDPTLLTSLVSHLQDGGLSLSKLEMESHSSKMDESILAFAQGNAKVSRKLLMPILRTFAG